MEFRDFERMAKRMQNFQEEHLPRIIRTIMEELGEALLSSIQDEIDRQNLIDIGLMWNSFSRGEDGNVWEWDQGRNVITLEVGSNLGNDKNNPNQRGYPRLLNEGYTVKKGHFVPGYWKKNGGFQYIPYEEAKNMKVKMKFKTKTKGIVTREVTPGFWARPRSFIGRRYFDIAVQGFEGGMNAIILKRLDEAMERWL